MVMMHQFLDGVVAPDLVCNVDGDQGLPGLMIGGREEELETTGSGGEIIGPLRG